MEEEFVTYEQALALKELGFDEDCFASFFTPNLYSIKFTATTKRNSNLLMGKDGCTAPLKQQILRWFREKYDLFGCIDLHISTPINWYVRIDIIKINDFIYHSEDDHKYFNTYEEAENACIDKLIEIAKESKS
jgi:hypothetical protein